MKTGSYDDETRGAALAPRRGRVRRDARGAALVEAAIVLPLLFLLLFGIIDFGSVYNDYLSVRQGTREGARQAAVSTVPLPAGATQSSAWASTPYSCNTSVSSSTSPDAYDLICYTKYRMGLDQSRVRVGIWFAPQTPAPAYAATHSVIICTQYRATTLTGFFNSILANKVLNSKIEIRIEQSSNTFLTSVQEPSLTASWPTNCTSPQ